MHRFYIGRAISESIVRISDSDQLHHLRDVLRLQVNDEVVVFDGEDNECVCSISDIGKEEVVLAVRERRKATTKMVKVAIACALPKKAGMDDIIDKLTQLGVDSIIPMETERVVVKLDEGKKADRLERWRRLACSAAQQSQRGRLPAVEPVASFANVLARGREYDLKLIAAVFGEKKSIREVLTGQQPASVLALIGPEGDFSPQEVELATAAGFIPVSLGDTVLRVDTAAIAIASYLNFSFLLRD